MRSTSSGILIPACIMAGIAQCAFAQDPCEGCPGGAYGCEPGDPIAPCFTDGSYKSCEGAPDPTPLCLGDVVTFRDRSQDIDICDDFMPVPVPDCLGSWIWEVIQGGQVVGGGSAPVFIYEFLDPGPFTVKLTVDDEPCIEDDPEASTSMNYRVIQVDADVEGVPENEEEDPGAFICLNDDFDEGGPLPDNETELLIEGDDELKTLTLRLEQCTFTGTWTVRVEQPGITGHIRVWRPDPDDPDGWADATNSSFPGTSTETLKIEGWRASDAEKNIEIWATFRPDVRPIWLCFSDIVKVTVVDIELDINGLADNVEESQGRYLGLNDDDDNGNGQPDKDDPGPVSGEDDLVALTLGRSPVVNRGTVRMSGGSGKIKVWTTSKKGTEVVLPKPWTLATETLPATVYLEGVAASGAERDIDLLLTWEEPERFACEDKVKATVVEIDLDIDGVTDALELTRGALIPVNDDDDNANGTVDVEDPPTTANEDELKTITLRIAPALNVGIVTLEDVSAYPGVEAWKQSNRTDYVDVWESVSWDLANETPPAELYVEGAEPSILARDVVLQLRYDHEGAHPHGEVAFTVMQVSSVEWIAVDPGDGSTNLFANNPASHGGDYRICAENNTPIGPLHEKVKVKATLNVAVPLNLAFDVNFRPFDMDDPMGNGAGNLLDTNDTAVASNGNDNLRAVPGITPSVKTSVTVTGGPAANFAGLEHSITARQPGDN